jgi:fructose-1,6-bisphosphatase/inositol monophosphatase family enzyme
MKYWDVCANEALIRGRFGIVTDKDKKPVNYETNGRRNFTIPNGLIIARNQSIYDLTYDRVRDYLSDLKVEKGRSL